MSSQQPVSAVEQRPLRWEHVQNPLSYGAASAHLACTKCRKKKLKCDGNKPSCSRCESNNWDCTYTCRTRPRANKHASARGPGSTSQSGASTPSQRQSAHISSHPETFEPDTAAIVSQEDAQTFGSESELFSTSMLNQSLLNLDPSLDSIALLDDFEIADPTTDISGSASPYPSDVTMHSNDVIHTHSETEINDFLQSPRFFKTCYCMADIANAMDTLSSIPKGPEGPAIDHRLAWQRSALSICEAALECKACRDNLSSVTSLLMFGEQVYNCLKDISDSKVDISSRFEQLRPSNHHSRSHSRSSHSRSSIASASQFAFAVHTSSESQLCLVGALGTLKIEQFAEWRACVRIIATTQLLKLRSILQQIQERIESLKDKRSAFAAALQDRVNELANSSAMTALEIN